VSSTKKEAFYRQRESKNPNQLKVALSMETIKLKRPDGSNSDNLNCSGDRTFERLEELNVQTLLYWYLEGEYDTDEGFALAKVGDGWVGAFLTYCPCCGCSPLDDLEEAMSRDKPQSLDNLQKEWAEWENDTKHVFAAARRA
jgi:hypothetical protein